jgi:predicted transcriptional regulator YheO
MFLKDDATEDVNENICIDEMNSLSSFENVSQIIDTLIDNIIGEIDVTRMKRSDNIELLSFMYDKGIFLTKGSIDKVAERLQVSRVTIYSYLDEIKKKKHNNAK